MNESSSRRLRLVPAIVFLITFALVLCTTVLITFRQPKLYAGTVWIKFLPVPAGTKAGRRLDPITPDASVVRLQFEVMHSEVVLSNVVSELDLNTKWGKRFAGGEILKTSETIALLRPQIELGKSSERGQAVVQVFNESPEEAARMANAIAKAYSEHRLEWRQGIIASDLEDFQKQYDRELPNEAEVDKLKADFGFTDANLTELTEAPSPQPMIRQLQSKHLAAQTALAEQLTLLTNVSDLPPESKRLALRAAISDGDKLQTQLNETNRVQVVLKELTNRVVTLQQAVADARAGVESAKSNAVAYAAASQRFEKIGPDVAIGKKLRLKIAEKIDLKKAELASLKSDIEIKAASLAKEPARPDVKRNLAYGAAAGLLLAFGAGWVARIFS